MRSFKIKSIIIVKRKLRANTGLRVNVEGFYCIGFVKWMCVFCDGCSFLAAQLVRRFVHFSRKCGFCLENHWGGGVIGNH